MKVKTRENGTNLAIKGILLSDVEMQKAGFWDGHKHDLDRWVYFKAFKHDIELSVVIPKDQNDENFHIDVLDDSFCQAYDYQYFIEKGDPPKFAYEVKEFVEEQVEKLQELGVISGYTKGMYI